MCLWEFKEIMESDLFNLKTIIDGQERFDGRIKGGEGVDAFRLWVMSMDLDQHALPFIKLNDEILSKKSILLLCQNLDKYRSKKGRGRTD